MTLPKDPRPKDLRVLITVKTYPTLSNKYHETVCTAGISEQGEWIRLYPIPYRKLDYEQKYKRYSWVTLNAVQNSEDFRPESYRPTNIEAINVGTPILPGEKHWPERRKWVTEHVPIYTNLKQLVTEAKDKTKCTSLALFKPSEILDFYWEKDNEDWDQAKVAQIEAQRKQLNMFELAENPFQHVNKLPFKFKYCFKDDEGKESNLMIEDWETGMLYWNCLPEKDFAKKRFATPEERLIACQKVKEKYLDNFARTKELYFFLGTTKEFHFVAPNPFVIIGTFHPGHLPPPQAEQLSLFDF